MKTYQTVKNRVTHLIEHCTGVIEKYSNPSYPLPEGVRSCLIDSEINYIRGFAHALELMGQFQEANKIHNYIKTAKK